jgi:hypothetical protein
VVVNSFPEIISSTSVFLSHLCGHNNIDNAVLVVHHHIGGLEIHQFETLIYWVVHHHIGGLEIFEATANNQ